MAAAIDSPEYAKAAGVLKDILPEGTDPMKVWSALQEAGLTITATEPSVEGEAADGLVPGSSGTLPEAAPSGAPIEGEPVGAGSGAAGMNVGIGNGPPTDDLILKAFQSAKADAEAKQKPA